MSHPGTAVAAVVGRFLPDHCQNGTDGVPPFSPLTPTCPPQTIAVVMRLALVFVAALLVTVSATQDFASWKVQHGKTYSSAEE